MSQLDKNNFQSEAISKLEPVRYGLDRNSSILCSYLSILVAKSASDI